VRREQEDAVFHCFAFNVSTEDSGRVSPRPQLFFFASDASLLSAQTITMMVGGRKSKAFSLLLGAASSCPHREARALQGARSRLLA